MVFSSPIFLFLFLPLTLAVCAMLPGTKAKNSWLLAMSLLFYVWGETTFIFLLLGSTIINYLLGLSLQHTTESSGRKAIVVFAILVNIGLLSFFKYSNFFVQGFNSVLRIIGFPAIHLPTVTLPIGISFFTFHALSYVLDVYRGKWVATKDPREAALYIFFFPQLIAGPILRWSAIGPQLRQRPMTVDMFADGVRRFVGGLAKKMLIANTLAKPADQIFALPVNELSSPVAWWGLVCYTLQIYFDFSGYSDMAVGMGKMFGFEFVENFRFPYIAQSIKDFWHRWHISLSSWFRDYVYIPLGGNRISEKRTYLNLVTVFLLCGLWHGASLTFVLWGLYHGFFLVLERTRFETILQRLPQMVRHLYLLMVVMLGWLVFRAETVTAAGHYGCALLGTSKSVLAQPILRYATKDVKYALVFGIIFSTPIWNHIRTRKAEFLSSAPLRCRGLIHASYVALELVVIVCLLGVSAAWLAKGTYNPFIYFRF